jgi:hypothetical protein
MLFMTYEKAKEVQFTLEENLRAAKEVFCAKDEKDEPIFKQNKQGVVLDHIRFGHDYRLATKMYHKAYKALDKFNAAFEVEFKAEIKAEKKAEKKKGS